VVVAAASNNHRITTQKHTAHSVIGDILATLVAKQAFQAHSTDRFRASEMAGFRFKLLRLNLAPEPP
jgi:hypothetical protein